MQERETLLTDALAQHSSVAYTLLASPEQVRQDITHIASQHDGLDITALRDTSQLQSAQQGEPLPTLEVSLYPQDGYTMMNLPLTLPYGTDLDAVIEDVIIQGYDQETALNDRRISTIRADAIDTHHQDQPSTILGTGDITYDMPITQKAAPPMIAMM